MRRRQSILDGSVLDYLVASVRNCRDSTTLVVAVWSDLRTELSRDGALFPRSRWLQSGWSSTDKAMKPVSSDVLDNLPAQRTFTCLPKYLPGIRRALTRPTQSGQVPKLQSEIPDDLSSRYSHNVSTVNSHATMRVFFSQCAFRIVRLSSCLPLLSLLTLSTVRCPA